LFPNPEGISADRVAKRSSGSRWKGKQHAGVEASATFDPTRPRRTTNPPGNASPHASGSGSGSKTHREEPGPIPIRLGSFGSSQAVAPGPEGRQMIAQRVSAGFHPPCTPSPSGAPEHPPPHEHEYPIASPKLGNTSEHETDKPRRTKRRLHLMASPAPLRKETPFHAETPSPPRLEYPFITGFLAAHGVAAQTRDQGSGVGKTRWR
jgi:hypothetical protein